MKIKEAIEITGGLSNTSKMPCKSYSLPAKECKIGSILAKKEGTTCSGCYALKNMYLWTPVIKAMYRRLESLSNPLWTEAMATLINKQKSDVFRWHDSGDLQSEEHLEDICKVCRLTPTKKHWLPTREIPTLKSFLKTNPDGIPDNLTIRVSDHFIDQKKRLKLGLPTSGVHHKDEPLGFKCKAPSQDGECKDCRACWSKDIKHVSYHKH